MVFMGTVVCIFPSLPFTYIHIWNVSNAYLLFWATYFFNQYRNNKIINFKQIKGKDHALIIFLTFHFTYVCYHAQTISH